VSKKFLATVAVLFYYLSLVRGHPGLDEEGDMPQLVTVSNIENLENLKTYINELFEKGRYAEISQAIGMHSILIDPEHMISAQDQLYHLVLNLLKKRIIREQGTLYSSWLIAFPALLARLVQEGRTGMDAAGQSALASRHAAFGPFTALDEFFSWALDDRRLPLEQIMACIGKTIELHRS
jgi:hypothetical protein